MKTLNRRSFLQVSGLAAVAGVSLSGRAAEPASPRPATDEILGQGEFRYRVNRFWGLLERARYPVEDCHGIVEDKAGRILLLTNETRNNLIAYTKDGEYLASWEHRFPKAHALRIENKDGEERYWITDHGISVVSLCTPDGRELRRIGPEAVASKYPDLTKYHPTNVAFMPDGDFYVSDGYGSSYVHHFDPDWKYMSSFGGLGDRNSNLHTPHSVWIDRRGDKPRLLICDRSNAKLKYFSLVGKFEGIVSLPGTQPCNIVQFGDHLVIPCLGGVVLVLDGKDRVVSVVGGEAPLYENDELKPIVPYNYALNHPHDTHIDAKGDLYVAQWDSYRTYPVKLERLPAAS